MPDQASSPIDILKHNRSAWNRQAEQQCEWSRPVSAETIAAARAGHWQARLTAGDIPASWLGDVKGKKILCLAAAGGQQAPVLAAAGAEVTVFDLSDQQLAMDRMVAEREKLPLTIVQGDMCDLSEFGDASFDIVFHPISNLYVPDIRPVWRECYRVLQPGGKLLASFYNPVVFVAERSQEDIAQGVIRPRHTLPYSEWDQLSEAERAGKHEKGEAFVFGHSLSDQIAGQLAAGFVLTGFQEDMAPAERFLIDRYLPTFIATCAVRPNLA
jgi:SAM-dependent methyltransferase